MILGDWGRVCGMVYIGMGSEHLSGVAYHVYYEHLGIYFIGSLYYMVDTERIPNQYLSPPHHHLLPHSLHPPPPPSNR